jgi:hypothetical protein
MAWTDDEALPEHIRTNCQTRGRFGLIARIEGFATSDRLGAFLAAADDRMFLQAPGHPRIAIGFDPGCWWFQDGAAFVYLPLGPGDRRDLALKVE